MGVPWRDHVTGHSMCLPEATLTFCTRPITEKALVSVGASIFDL